MTSSNSSAETEIPSGLNRIKTRRVPSSHRLSSAIHKLPQPPDSRASASASGYGVPRPPTKQKAAGEESKRVPKGKKVALVTSFRTKDSKRGYKDTPPTEMDYSEVSALDKDVPQNKQQMEWKDLMGKHPFPKNTHLRKTPKGLKSFSHEIGPRGGIQPAIQRAHSYNDLKELLGSLQSSFDAAKQVVNAELAAFAGDVLDVLGKKGDLFSKSKRMAEDLLILAHQCTEMTPSEFRGKCEGIVQDLVEKRQQCEAGIQKQLVTRILFILTRCTRVLLLQKDSDPTDEDSLHKFKQFFESIPAIEMKWVPKSVNTSDKDDTVKIDKVQINGGSNLLSVPVGTQFGSDQQLDENDVASRSNSNESCTSDSGPHIISIPQCRKVFLDPVPQCTQLDVTLPSLVQKYCSRPLKESETFTQAFDSVICRICEEVVPSSHLESHSYICAYADNYGWKGSDVDERLSKIAETLEQIIDSYPQSSNASNGNPEILRSHTSNSAVESESQSPKIIEWHSKGTEGMFEDLHDMDTTFLDDSHLSSNIFLKPYLNMKLGQSVAPSSTGSFTSISSTNTPRTSHFDLFWLEHNSPFEPEDVMQMTDLADIARCVANTEHMMEGASEYFLACMHDLHDILQRSKVKALVIDTFGGRIENLLRDKYLLACELMDENTRTNKGNGVLGDSASESTISTPFHPMTKERTSIDDFEIIKPITKGAFGKVFLARKRTTRDLFAIKILKKLDMIRKNDVDRIFAERNILITVRNPFVVRFFYSFTSRENLYLVMEYLNGGDLYSLLQKVGCLEEDIARIYVTELVLALEYLHSLGIVHRDLKPENILIAHDGHIKLTDFGLSKIGLINNAVDLSGTHGLDYSFGNHRREDRNQQSALGTPDYLAPEILLGMEHGYAADWWSVGIILFELLIGIPPFSARFPEIIFDNILNEDIPWPNVPNDLSYEAQDLINRFLIHDPDQRLGANGASEVKAHPFFSGINWDTLASQKAAFVPNPESAEDTSYFMSRYSQSSVSIPEDHYSGDSASDTPVSSSKSSLDRIMDEAGEQAEFDSSTPLNISLINFSFKNLSQLASINYDVLLQSGNNSSKCSSPSKGMEP